MEPILVAERYTHGVRLSGYTRETLYKMQGFLESLSLKEPRKIPGRGMIMELKKKYYGITEDHKQVFIHRNCLKDLIVWMGGKNVPEERIKIVDIAVPGYEKASYEMLPQYVLRDYQEIICEDILREWLHSARIDLQTGKGKTLTSLAALARMGCRCVVMVPPKYFGIWEKALRETYKDIEQRWVTVSGSAELQQLINRGMENDLAGIDVIIISAVTYRGYIDAFERLGDDLASSGYNVPPPVFHGTVGAGLQINDEIQEDPGLVFRTDMYTNVFKQIYLSATPFTGNAYVTKMIDVMLPPPTMCRLPVYDVYINVIGLLYSEPSIKPKDYLTPFKNTYNHARYETQMLKDKKRLKTYLDMAVRIIQGVYVNDRIEGQKALALCATVAFIQTMVERLKEAFPDLEINEHVSGSPYARLFKNDVTVSTIKSSGTGVDIPNLRECVLFQHTGSKKDSIQIMGRLRPLKGWPDVTPRFTYLVNQHIPQACKYAALHKETFLTKAKSMVMRRIA